MEKSNLEKVVKSRVKPIIDDAMQRFLGARIVEIEADISDRLARPIIDMDIDTSIGFKKSKEEFKRIYLVRLLQTHMGNITEVSRISGMDRRSVHRLIKSLGIDMEEIRKNLLSQNYVDEEKVKGVVEHALSEYQNVLNPVKLKKMYEGIPSLSKNLLKQMPLAEPTMNEAEMEFERVFIRKALAENEGNVSLTARKIGLRYETLHRKMKSLDM